MQPSSPSLSITIDPQEGSPSLSITIEPRAEDAQPPSSQERDASVLPMCKTKQRLAPVLDRIRKSRASREVAKRRRSVFSPPINVTQWDAHADVKAKERDWGLSRHAPRYHPVIEERPIETGLGGGGGARVRPLELGVSVDVKARELIGFLVRTWKRKAPS